MHHLSKVMALAGCLLWCLVAGAYEESAPEEDPTEKLVSQLQTLQGFSGRYAQQTIDADQQLADEDTGTILVSSPGKFRLSSESQVLVSDGTDFWSWDADLEQVIISHLSDDLSQVPILLLSGSSAQIADHYTVQFYADESFSHFVLKPRQGNQLFDTVTLTFEGSIPQAVTIRYGMSQRTVIRFTEVKLNPETTDAQFQFIAPAGTDVIDERQS